MHKKFQSMKQNTRSILQASCVGYFCKHTNAELVNLVTSVITSIWYRYLTGAPSRNRLLDSRIDLQYCTLKASLRLKMKSLSLIVRKRGILNGPENLSVLAAACPFSSSSIDSRREVSVAGAVLCGKSLPDHARQMSPSSSKSKNHRII